MANLPILARKELDTEFALGFDGIALSRPTREFGLQNVAMNLAYVEPKLENSFTL